MNLLAILIVFTILGPTLGLPAVKVAREISSESEFDDQHAIEKRAISSSKCMFSSVVHMRALYSEILTEACIVLELPTRR
jgi:hypothetical protein